MDALQERLRGRQVRPAGEDQRDIDPLAGERGGRLLRRLDGRAARVAAVRERGADADRHGGHDTEAMKARVLALFGPTAVGKTEVAIAIAARLRAPVSTRSPFPPTPSRSTGPRDAHRRGDAEQQRGLEHRLVSFLPVDARFSVAEYAALAHAQIDELLAAGATPIVVGGTGLYSVPR